MRDRHQHIFHDSALLKSIHRQVEQELIFDKSRFKIALWTKFCFYFFLLVSSYSALYWVKSEFLFVLNFVLYGFSALLFAFNFAHDFSHGTIFRKPKWDNLGFILIYALNGAHAEAWKQRHVESHHFAPNVEHYDTDLDISNLIRVTPNSERHWFHKFQHLYAPLAYTTYSLFWIFIKDFTIYFSKGRKPRILSFHISFWMQKTFYFTYLLVLPLLFSNQSWYIVLIAFISMHLLQSLFLLLTFFMTHHVEGLEYPTINAEGIINASWMMNQIKSSNDMYPFSKAANFIFGGFNNHIAHHLFPHVHHIHYPEISKILYDLLRENRVTPHQTSYWEGICSHLRLLKKMGANPPAS